MWNSTATPPTQSLGHLQNDATRNNFLIGNFSNGTGVRCSRSNRAVSSVDYVVVFLAKIPGPLDTSRIAMYYKLCIKNDLLRVWQPGYGENQGALIGVCCAGRCARSLTSKQNSQGTPQAVLI